VIRRFNRFELKYIITAEMRNRVRDDLARQMLPDGLGDNGYYRVTSLYYDTPDVSCYWSKVEGIRYRRKLRIRVYGAGVESDDHPVMVEIKQRINRTVQKRRVKLPVARAYRLAEGDLAVSFEDAADELVASEVRFLARSLDLRPTVVISYLRQAWVGSRYEPGLRVTFDEDLSCRGPENRLRNRSPAHLFMHPDRLIMEVKANETVPLWLTRMLATHGCTLVRISKFCTGLKQLSDLERSPERLREEQWTS
jgi:hypothetical protein